TIYHTTLAAKILSIIINKAASFDPEGIGLEMEAGKPDWYDALNGLPALLGSSLSETLELKRLALYLQTHLSKETEISIPVETKRFLDQLKEQLTKTKNPFSYWEKTFQLKEDFRQKTKFGVSGRESTLGPKELEAFLDKVIGKCDQGIKKCLKKYKNYHTYFINKVEGSHNNQTPLPLFLEGFVHALKVEKDKKIYGRVKKSPLYDKELKMYKVNASLEETPTEIGRARIFIPGWLENESIWLHMEYKYMLELLKAGLYKEFFTDLKNVMVPFLDPQKYKRSILENSSFLVSSAHPNPANHGRGFVARLSGATAEFVDMWLLMTTGKNIFSLDKNGQLRFKLSPILPAWLFKDKKLSFTLLGSIKVTYENPKGKNTFGSGGVSPISYTLKLDHKEITINKSFIPEAYAKMIRARQVYEIVVKLG
ncbi:MAG: cellobiose phosphorylase, partial [Candidatus Margulisbacteria bacterium]|nr:cellobiose phosphorylase [Candidatus Margulisiibacteriota bacterium]